jgi:xylulokinase
MDLLIGIDLGTTACKVTVVADDLTSTTLTSLPYPISSPHRGWAEQNPLAWGEAVDATVQRALESVGVGRHNRLTLSITGQMHSLVLLDANGHPSRPAILWADRRATAECTMIENRIPEIAGLTGNPPLPAFTLPQLLWVRSHEPDVFSRATTVLLPKDYLRWRYTERIATDWTDASGTGMLDSRTRDWSEPILSALEIDLDLLPSVADPVADGGVVQTNVLPGLQGARTAVGVGDQFAEALSAGLTRAGDMAIILGTSAVVLGVSDHLVPGSFCHAQSDLWLRLDSLHAGGKSMQWLRDVLAPGQSLATFASAAASAPPGAHNLLFLPFLMGERGARGGGAPGAFVGLTTEHTRGDLIRAVLEGVAFELRRLQQTRGTPLPTDVLTLKGGGAQNELWCRIVSGAFGIPYRTTDRDAAYGAALTAGLSRGWWPDWQSVPGLSGPMNESGLGDAEVLADRYWRYCLVVEALAQDF